MACDDFREERRDVAVEMSLVCSRALFRASDGKFVLFDTDDLLKMRREPVREEARPRVGVDEQRLATARVALAMKRLRDLLGDFS